MIPLLSGIARPPVERLAKGAIFPKSDYIIHTRLPTPFLSRNDPPQVTPNRACIVPAASDAAIMRDQLEFLIDKCQGNKVAVEDISRLCRVRLILMEPFAVVFPVGLNPGAR